MYLARVMILSAENHVVSDWPTPKIINLIVQLRNELIIEFLDEQKLNAYFLESYNKQLSKVRREFLFKELKDLSKTPLDLVRYSGLIRQIKETNSAKLTEGMDSIFYSELEEIFKRYIF